MGIDTPRRGDIAAHNTTTSEITTRLKAAMLSEALERAGLRTRRDDTSGSEVIAAWDPQRSGPSVVLVVVGGNTAEIVRAVWKEVRDLAQPTPIAGRRWRDSSE